MFVETGTSTAHAGRIVIGNSWDWRTSLKIVASSILPHGCFRIVEKCPRLHSQAYDLRNTNPPLWVGCASTRENHFFPTRSGSLSESFRSSADRSRIWRNKATRHCNCTLSNWKNSEFEYLGVACALRQRKRPAREGPYKYN